ncbi:uncharacterized mitochondrial protein AtMg00810-like [Pyrus communis]|uniref:uncharacterized mitochondrial protein AtMg00810-like n=1 Tax=Pyrus communis TaxID=23211 RepID=UPI0035C0E588
MNTAYKRRIPTNRLVAMAYSQMTSNNGNWLLDTGANAHVTPDLQNLVNPKEYCDIPSRDYKNNMHLTQSKYALDLLEHTKFTDVKPISTPVPTGHKLSQYDSEPYSNLEQYRMVVGALQYLTITRPDLSYAVNQVCQFMHMPRTIHWITVKRIQRYLKAMYDHGLVYTPGNVRLNAFSDADYA